MPQLNLFNQKGEMLSTMDLIDTVFGIKPHQQSLYDVVNQQKAAMRQGTHATKNRSSVSGGGKKPWAQKGTGNARHGTIRSPLWRGGGVVFGPHPRDYSFKMNAKVRKLAMISALSLQIQKQNIKVIDSLEMTEYKTKNFQQFLNNLNIKNKVLVVVDKLTENLVRATNNLAQVTLEQFTHISVYQIMSIKSILMTKAAITQLGEILK
ncbi:50S ribosomal protein L4 [Candidatus Phytoplasma phoenicium]|uniref:Large ribosomal subunit protein uL4 n=1 Tax=Candidatus Phytoplasma phoenicium TaxID=198422 RepID=A0A0L0MKG8_9MOLU|nr:50S ribosomal protein L4 [Candidatus Phytoplasma phoenicium]KND62791.1 50S ribosomal protein L4 [Candidatus Phytoplasma phoenicium]